MSNIQEIIKLCAIPLFGLLIYLEYILLKKTGVEHHNSKDTLINLSLGVLDRVMDVFYFGVAFTFLNWVYSGFALFHIPENIYVWVILFFLVDFLWYWYHRLGHEVTFFWCFHVVHHQSEYYNLSVSARITVFQSFIRLFFWGFLALLGFSPTLILPVILAHGVYQFFIHTPLKLNLGLLEKILVTPSHHKVHHASNEQYLDKNYGGVLIVWDKLFKTYEPEVEAPRFGLKEKVVYSNLGEIFFKTWIDTFKSISQSKNVSESMKLLVNKPKGNPNKSIIDKQAQEVNEKHLDARLWYVILLAMALPFYIYNFKTMGTFWQWTLATSFLIAVTWLCYLPKEKSKSSSQLV